MGGLGRRGCVVQGTRTGPYRRIGEIAVGIFELSTWEQPGETVDLHQVSRHRCLVDRDWKHIVATHIELSPEGRHLVMLEELGEHLFDELLRSAHIIWLYTTCKGERDR